jgi:hypothetical protein
MRPVRYPRNRATNPRSFRTPYTPLFGDVLDYLNRGPYAGTGITGIFDSYDGSKNPYLIDFEEETTDTTKPVKLGVPSELDGDRGPGPYGIRLGDPSIRTEGDYNPYAYRRTIDKGSTALALYPEFYGLGQKRLPGIMGTAVDFIKSKLPVNPRAILENELLGKGFAIDDIGRIVGDPNTAEGIMAGYNAAKITSKTFDKRRDAIMKGLMKTNPEAARERLALLDEAEANMLGARSMTKDILSDRYGEIDKYQFTGPNVQGDFYTSIKDDEDDEDENYYDYDYDSFGPTGPARQNLYVERGLKAAEAEIQRKAREEAARKAREEAARKAREEAARRAQEEARQRAEVERMRQQNEREGRGGYQSDFAQDKDFMGGGNRDRGLGSGDKGGSDTMGSF